MEKRRRQRARRRLTCELEIGRERFTAIVRDLSPRGLFVQTRARPAEDSVLFVVFPAEDGREEIRVEAGVARQRMIPPRLQASVAGGLGLELLDPPDAYQALIAAAAEQLAECQAVSPGAAAEDRRVRTFRVRLKQRDRPNARILTVRCESSAGARARALAQAGRDWTIADIQEE